MKLVTAGKRQSRRGHPAGLQEGLPEGSRSREAGVLQREPCARGRRSSEQGFGDLKGLPKASSEDFLQEPPCTRLLVPSPAGGDAVFLFQPSPLSCCFVPVCLFILMKHGSFVSHLHGKHTLPKVSFFILFVSSSYHMSLYIEKYVYLYSIAVLFSLLTKSLYP